MTRLRPDLPALARIDTPALIIDEVALQSNIERMAKTAAAHKVALRPHAKTHKSAAIARRQLKAGATGIACATLLEAEALAAAGVTGLLVTSPVVGADKAARLARLNRVSPVAVVVDHRDQLEGLCAALADGDPPLGVLVDVDVGQGRTGVTTLQDGHALARMAAADGRFAFRGLQGYAGHVQHIFAAAEREFRIRGNHYQPFLVGEYLRWMMRGVGSVKRPHVSNRIIRHVDDQVVAGFPDPQENLGMIADRPHAISVIRL